MNRYNRQIILDEVGQIGQQRLTNAKVLVVGAGGLGCPVLQYLAAAGVGTLGIADGDFVSETNLNRQVLYDEKDIGEQKAECAKSKLLRFNPKIKIDSFAVFLEPKNASEILSQFDIIVDCTDQIHTRYLLNDACVLLEKPLVYGAIHKFEGQVSVFNFQGGPTYRDLFPTPPKPESVPTCNEVGVLGVVPGIIGSMQAHEVLKIILGYGKVLSGVLWIFNSKTNESQKISFQKTPVSKEVPSSFGELRSTDYITYCNPTWAAAD